MCGIAGIFAANDRDHQAARENVRTMTLRLVHRGPDDEGLYADGRIALGVRRLAVIDIEHGRQPMATDNGQLVMVYNGEIYNQHLLRQDLQARGVRFLTRSDTEVLLQQIAFFGVDSLRCVEGMFAFAAWSTERQELILARDWLGQKSLYWADTPIGFAFASEIKALLSLPGVTPDLDLEALSHYMSFRYLPGESTFFRGINQLRPGHVMTVGRGGRRLEELWRPDYQPKVTRTESDLLEELDELLTTVVPEHLMSEVPLGCLLSGGIDSSLISHYAGRASDTPLRTFAIGVHEAGQSELPWARRVASACGAHHTESLVDPDLALLTPRMVASLEEPVDPFGAGVYAVSEVARRHVTVALGGDGGDELFAGYDRYQGQRLAQLYSSIPRPIRHGMLRPALARVPDSFGYKSLAARLHWLDQMADSGGFERFAESLCHLRFSHEAKQALFCGPAAEALKTDSSELLRTIYDDAPASEVLDRMLHVDCQTRLAENQLPTVDRMSMAHSLELRSPFLDRRVATFAMQLPTSLKLRRGRLKYLPRMLAARHFGQEIALRPKQGFGFPLALWLRGPLRGLMLRLLDESRFVAAGLFRREALATMLREHLDGRRDHNYRLWMWFNLEVFWRTWIENDPVEVTEAWIQAARQG